MNEEQEPMSPTIIINVGGNNIIVKGSIIIQQPIAQEAKATRKTLKELIKFCSEFFQLLRKVGDIILKLIGLWVIITGRIP
jgi:hypothetical protein